MVQVHSRVGADGVLKLSVPLGVQDANRDVVITIQSLPAEGDHPSEKTPWHNFLDETYGSCAEMGLVRGRQGEFEIREKIN